MESSKLAIKLFAADPSVLDAAAAVPVFHSWIQMHSVPGHLLIDVADYAHVPDGPGTVLVAHEANFSLDRAGGRTGLLYVRKQPLPGGFEQRLRAVLTAALEAAVRLEEAAALKGKLKFRTDEFLFRIYDRLLAPNTGETFEQVKPVLESVVRSIYGGATPALEYHASPGALFEVSVMADGVSDVATLLSRLGATVGATA